MAYDTIFLKKKLGILREEILIDILKALQERKSMKLKFTETEAPRFYFDGGWRDIIQLSIGFMGGPDAIEFGWQDERCSNKGANAFVHSAQISTEILIQFHELIYTEK